MSPQYSRKPHLARIIIRLFNDSEVALLAAGKGILNVSAFARIIQSKVEQLAQRKVGVKTINMTLLRYLKEKQIEFSFPLISVKGVQELGSRYGYSMIKVKFNRQPHQSKPQLHPSRFYVVLARLAIHKIGVVKLSVSSGVLTIWVEQQQMGLALIILRSLIKKERRFNHQSNHQTV